MFVRATPGRKDRDPMFQLPIPEAGVEVPEDSYWTRRKLDGDVLVIAPVPAAKPPSPKVKE